MMLGIQVIRVQFMLTKKKSFLWTCCWLVLLYSAPLVVAQEKDKENVQRPSSTGQEQAENVLRVNTRVVFINALVKDKKKDAPVRNLTRDNFTVLDDGRVRKLTYLVSEAKRGDHGR